MTDPDLTEEELVLLAQHGDSEDPDVPKRRRAPRRREDAVSTPVERSTPDVPEPTPEPDDVEEALDRAAASIGRVDDLVEQRTQEALADVARAASGPEPDHPHAPPAQMDYGDPWGLLPLQMRHHRDGSRAF